MISELARVVLAPAQDSAFIIKTKAVAEAQCYGGDGYLCRVPFHRCRLPYDVRMITNTALAELVRAQRLQGSIRLYQRSNTRTTSYSCRVIGDRRRP